jgi:hypothetical protein
MATPDLKKLLIHSAYPAFKNNEIYTGTLTISGTTVEGTNVKTFNVALNSTPDLVDIIFNGPAAFGGVSDLRPADGWFKQGAIYVRGDGAGYANYPTPWVINSHLVGSQLTITAYFVQQFTTALTLTDTNFSYRLVDYSAF